MRITTPALLAATDWAAAMNSTSVPIQYARGMAIMAVNVVAASTAITFVDGDVGVVANTVTKTAHGWATGRKVAATSNGSLPGGLSTTTYYMIVVDANTLQFASSAALALAGTAIDITSAAGGGTHTLTPAALSTATLSLQWSLDSVNWFDIANTSTAVSATGNIGWNDVLASPYYAYIRAVGAIAAGQINSTISSRILSYHQFQAN